MEKVCNVCGGDGCEEASTLRCQCHITHEYIYCMKTRQKDVPQDWLCEDCGSTMSSAGECLLGNNNNFSTGNRGIVSPKSCAKELFPIKSTSDSSIGTCLDNRNSNFPPKPHGTGVQVYHQRSKTVEKGKVKFIPVEETIMLASGARKVRSPPTKKLCSKPSCVRVNGVIQTPKVTWAGSENFDGKFSLKVAAIPCPRLPPQMKSPKHDSPQHSLVEKQEVSQASKEKKGDLTGRKNIGGKCSLKVTTNPNSEHPSQLNSPKHGKLQLNSVEGQEVSQTSKEMKGYRAGFKGIEGKCSLKVMPNPCSIPPLQMEYPKHGNLQLGLLEWEDVGHAYKELKGGNLDGCGMALGFDAGERKTPRFLENLEHTLPNRPALIATWKGSFHIGDGRKFESFDDFQAHPPSKVHRRAYEFSKLMPSSLQLELLPRHSLWSDIFQDYYPTGNDIALYFFPSGHEAESLEKGYYYLLNFLTRHDFALRSSINDIQLLIFSSEHLSEDSQGSSVFRFLWGIFYCVIPEELSQNIIPLQYSCEEADLEIDMTEGEDVGKVDVVVDRELIKKPKGRTCEENTSDVKQKEDKNTLAFESEQPSPSPSLKACDDGSKLDFPPGFENFLMQKLNAKVQGSKPEEKACAIVKKKDKNVFASGKPFQSPSLESCGNACRLEFSPGFENILMQKVGLASKKAMKKIKMKASHDEKYLTSSHPQEDDNVGPEMVSIKLLLPAGSPEASAEIRKKHPEVLADWPSMDTTLGGSLPFSRKGKKHRVETSVGVTIGNMQAKDDKEYLAASLPKTLKVTLPSSKFKSPSKISLEMPKEKDGDECSILSPEEPKPADRAWLMKNQKRKKKTRSVYGLP